MSFVDVKDRIPTKVLDNKAVRYGVYDENGKLLRYEYIKREDEPIEEGTVINKVFFNEMYGMDNYETLQLASQDNISEPTIADNVVGQIDSGIGTANWVGHIVNKLDINTWDFSMTSNDGSMYLTKNISNSYTAVGIIPYNSSGSADATLDTFNLALRRNGEAKTYLYFETYRNTSIDMVWDFQVACTPNFYASGVGDGWTSSYKGYARLYGSNDKSSWSQLTVVSTNVNYTVTTSYRYFKLTIFLPGGGTGTNFNSKYTLYYAYFTNVPDTIPKYRNNFTSTNDFAKKECVNVIVPSYEYDGYIGQNTINNIPVNFVLNQNMDYKLRYDGEKIVNDLGRFTNVISGTLGATLGASITLDEVPKLVVKCARYNQYIMMVKVEVPTSGEIVNNLVNPYNNTTNSMEYYAIY